MKRHFLINCHTVLDAIYEFEKDSSLPFLTQIKIKLHLLFCHGCAEELRIFQRLKKIMETDFFPSSPHFEDLLMERLFKENYFEEKNNSPAGFSLRGWVIIGFFVLLSLSSSFFGVNFILVAASEGISFLLPAGITVGMVVTCYGALFIGSHLKEFSIRFRLR